MKTDKQLLELAAKAAGLNVCAEACGDGDGIFIGGGDGDLAIWSPLTDDGDALRLLVILRLDINWTNSGRIVVRAAFDNAISLSSAREEKEANMRRAIVETAADLGEAMP